MTPAYIYTLSDPSSGATRYVGKATDPDFRLKLHIERSIRGKQHSCRWIKQLLVKGQRPLMNIVEIVPYGGDWQASERRWISKLKEVGADLTNVADGGRGGLSGYRHSTEALERIGARHRGKYVPPEVGAKISAAKKGKKCRPRTEEHRRNISKSLLGKPKSPGHAVKCRLNRLGKAMSIDARKRISAAMVVRWARIRAEGLRTP